MSRVSISVCACWAVILVCQFASVDPALGQEKLDLSVPQFDAKPVVWVDDWKPADLKVTGAKRKSAKEMVGIADRLKSAQEYKKAEAAYLRAMKTDPTWAYPPYQLACNYELWNQHDKAVPMFEKAIELGFSDFPTALGDDELGELRDAEDFNKTLTKIRKRYIESGKKDVGTPIAVKPKGKKPDEGWPVILMLHGYGDSNVNYVPFAKAWAKLGFVAVAVPGSTPGGDGRFIWNLKSTDPTLKDLRAIMKSKLLAGIVNKEKVFLLGFSQGALHALLLTAEHSDEFAGVVALSPGGSVSGKTIAPKISKGRAARLAFIHGEQEPHAPIVKRWKDACAKSDWKFMSSTHPGGHHFPQDWKQQRPEIAKFLVE